MSGIVIKETPSGYRQFWRDGKRLPSPSSITSRFKDSGGLIYWANREGLEGRTLDEAKQAAVTPGSIVHRMIECDVRGREFDRSEWSAKIAVARLDADEVWSMVASSWSAYQAWKSESQVNIIAAETTLASEQHSYGGTFDAARVSSRVCIIDWKTGSLYPEHLLQLAGYVVLWEENLDTRLDGVELLAINKTHGGFHHAYWPRKVMQVAVDQFLALRECYDRDKRISKLL